MIQFISATPTEVNYENKELSNKNCTDFVKNVSLGIQEELEDPEPSEEFKTELQQHFKLLENKVLNDDREKRHINHGM